MSSNDERLVVMLEARIRDFERNMQRAESRGARTYQGLRRNSRSATQAMEADMVRSTNRINQALATTTAQIGGVARAFAGGFIGAFALNNVIRGVRQAVSSLAALGTTARDTGVDVEELQGLMRGFARAANVTEDEIGSAMIRFNRRIGEAVSGGGPLQTTLDRYRINIRRANGEMKTQAELLREVARAIRNAGTEQERLSIAQAAFGDSGRRMAQAMAGGSDAIDRMVSEARSAGDVIDRNLIHRAEILDTRFKDLTKSVGQFFRALAVTVATGSVETPIDTLERLFGTLERARAALGDGVFEALIRETGELRELDGVSDGLRDVAFEIEELVRSANWAENEIAGLAFALDEMGHAEAAAGVRELYDQIRELASSFSDGSLSAEDYNARLEETVQEAVNVVAALGDVDASRFDNVVRSLGQLIGQLVAARAAAVDLGQVVNTGAAPSTLGGVSGRVRSFGQEQLAANRFLQGEGQRSSRTREQISLESELAAVQRRAREAGITLTNEQAEAQARLNLQLAEAANPSRSSGGGSGSEDFNRAVEAIRQRTRELEAEALALAAAAESGREYGEAIMFAHEKARLMNAAQRQGLTITPELEARIDDLAEAYVRAGAAAQTAADQMREAQERAERGAEAMSDLFLGIIQGGDSARQALAQLLQQLAQVQMQKAMLGVSKGGGSGFFGWLGGLLGLKGGGQISGPGTGRSDSILARVSNGEFIVNAKSTARNLPLLHAINEDRLPAFAHGGLASVVPTGEAGAEVVFPGGML